MWTRNLLIQNGTMYGKDSCDIRVDNQGCISLAQNHNFHERTKHIEIKIYLVRENIKDGTLLLRQVPTKILGADILTKFLPQEEHRANQNHSLNGLRRVRSVRGGVL